LADDRKARVAGGERLMLLDEVAGDIALRRALRVGFFVLV